MLVECNTFVTHTFNVCNNAISSVIIVGAIIAALSGNEGIIFSSSSIFGFYYNSSSSKYIWRIFSYSKNVSHDKKEKGK